VTRGEFSADELLLANEMLHVENDWISSYY
jgi:hypothetical protein